MNFLVSSSYFLIVLFFLFPLSNDHSNIGSFFYFHNVSFTLIFIIFFCLDLYFSFFKKGTILRLFFLFLFLNILLYQKKYQTEFSFSLILYFISNLNYLSKDTFEYFYHFSLLDVFLFILGGCSVLIGEFFKDKKNRFSLILTFVFIFFVWMIPPNHKQTEKITNSNLNFESNQNVLIPEKPDILVFFLEGVNRKSIISLKSNLFNLQELQGSHYFIPMPHSSKSLEAFLTGNSNLGSTRWIPPFTSGNTLPEELKKIGYQTYFLYAQSLYFENLNLFLPKIFDFAYGKDELLNLGGKKIEGFDWGMDDSSFIHILENLKFSDQNPSFVWIGFSQTHSPYVSKLENKKLPAYERYIHAIEENLSTIDVIIKNWIQVRKRPTLFILTSDHGESFGEEGAKNHNYSLFNQEIDVPFLMLKIPEYKQMVPKLGASKDFKESILAVIGSNKSEPLQNINDSRFFSSDYKLKVYGKTWNSEIQKYIIFNNKKYIYLANLDRLLEMNLDDTNRTEVKNLKVKKEIMKDLFLNTK